MPRNKKYKRKNIPKVREQTWLLNFGKKYQHKCYINWCDNNRYSI